MLVAACHGIHAMILETGYECITGELSMITTILEGDTEVILIAAYGHVGLGLKGPNFEMLLTIVVATNGKSRRISCNNTGRQTLGFNNCDALTYQHNGSHTSSWFI